MKRYPHYWWQLRGKYCPSRIAVLDCDMATDTVPGSSEPCADRVIAWSLNTVEYRAGVAVSATRLQGEDATGIWKRLASLCISKEATWVFIPMALRVLGAAGFWDMLESGDIELCGKDWRVDRGAGKTGEDRSDGLCVIEDPPTLISCRPRGHAGKWLFLDTRNYGLDNESAPRQCVDRCEWYTHGLCAIVQTLRQGVPVSLRGTAASQAMQVLRTRYDCVRLHCHTDEHALKLERAAYYGGRCECYRIGDVPCPVYHVDVRNQYPSICLTLPIPVSLREYTDDREAAYRMVNEDTCSCAAECKIRANEPCYPYRCDGTVVYPTGILRTYLCGPELERALHRGDIISVSSAARYTCAPYLSGFYRDGLKQLERARILGNSILVQWWKRVMNALPGKFGEPGRRWVPTEYVYRHEKYDHYIHPGPDDIDVQHRNLGFYTQRLETHGESYWSMPAIAAWITAAARVRLWDYIATAGRDHVWYVDTDSLLTDRIGYDRLLSAGYVRDGEAGYLRLIGEHRSCTIYGIRHYQCDDTISCAGVTRGSIRAGETREAYWRRVRTSTELAMGCRPGSIGEYNGFAGYEQYRHGIVGRDGMVRPLEFDDGDIPIR